MPDPDRRPSVFNALAGVLLTLDLLIGVATFLILGLSIVFGSTGFGGDTTTTAAQRAAEGRAQLAGTIALLLAGAAIPAFVCLRRRADLRVLVLAGLALGEACGLLLLTSAMG